MRESLVGGLMEMWVGVWEEEDINERGEKGYHVYIYFKRKRE